MGRENKSVSLRHRSIEKRIGANHQMEDIIQQCRVIIFDLDGTLYEGTSHFEYYAKKIQELLSQELQQHFQKDYQEMLDGIHPVKIGTVYDAEMDYILTISPMTLEVLAVRNWKGQLICKEKQQELYPFPIHLDDERMIGIGDGWFLPVALGIHYGAKDIYHCYNKTKEYMASKEFLLEKTKGLKEALERLGETKKLVLMTNSDADDVKRLLQALELADVFDFEITDAFKPNKTEDHLQKIMILYSVQPEEVVAIGDNFINEIAPALKLGMYGIYLTNQSPNHHFDKLITVPTLEGLL